jgi:hypothetical protein
MSATRPAELKELAWLLSFRSERRALRAARAATDAGADGTRAERGSIFGVGIVPTDGTSCQLWEAENSVCRRFLGSSDARQVLIYAPSITVTEQNCSL